MDLELKGRVAFVTGGSLGIGKAIAAELAREGADVMIGARGRDRLEAAAAEIVGSLGGSAGKVLVAPMDNTDTGSIESAMNLAVARLGRLDILVNNAAHPGGLVRAALADADPAGLLEDIDVKVVGYLRCCKAAVPHMRRLGFGRIINVGGLTGRGSKQISGMRNVAIVHLSKVLSDQLGPDGITVNTIHPGIVETPHAQDLFEAEAAKQGISVEQVRANYASAAPIRRILRAEEMGWIAAFLASPKSAAITGESIGCEGGMSRGVFL